MLSKPVEQLLLEVAAHYGDRTEQVAKKDPEAYLVSILMRIKEDLPVVSSTLMDTIEMADYDGHLNEAKQLLSPSAKSPPQKRPRSVSKVRPKSLSRR